MHRSTSSFWLGLAAALYVSAAGCASLTPLSSVAAQSAVPDISATAASAPVVTSPTDDSDTPVTVAPAPVVTPPPAQSAPIPAPPVPPVIVISGEQSEPHIALLLPLNSETFRRAAEALRAGFMAAAKNQPVTLKVKVYGSTDESKEIAALYQTAINSGAVVVAGPLTRDGVTALAEQVKITVPTLALNYVDEASLAYFDDINTQNLFFFSLSIEAEARLAAQMAIAAKLKNATVVSTGTSLSKRLALAFTKEWDALGGTISEEILYLDDRKPFGLLSIEPGNMIFLAAEAEKARVIRPYINAALPIYATSQIFTSNTKTLSNYDLDNIRFTDMPWLLQKDHPAVMIYPRANPALTPDMERLYAMGIDAFRLLHILGVSSLQNNVSRGSLPMDGVTGYIDLVNKQFIREAIPAQIKQGQSQLLTRPKLPPVSLRP
ncbi:MAG: penicillin-binding protein activator [Candidatus Nitrotoga sp.]